ncbi:MAG TPA: GNAT family N-acetyltransferase [Anaerolineales bacterium]|nr:GNAT family N-acetyltransferase [Anaerolineales bacterium]
MESAATVIDYTSEYQSSIRRILTRIGWGEQYISSAEQNMQYLSQDKENYRVYLAIKDNDAVGFLYVQFYAWNQLCQIHGLAVDPDAQRVGIASALVARAEDFAKTKNARGVYVDTPTTNTGGRKFYEAIGYQFGYIMPRYYEDKLDGVTYQKFFDALQTS